MVTYRFIAKKWQEGGNFYLKCISELEKTMHFGVDITLDSKL